MSTHKSLLKGIRLTNFTLTILENQSMMYMKTKYAVAMLTMGMSVAAMAQESDDMYFNSKDRNAVNKANEIVLAKRYQQDDMNAVRSNPVNPSDTYSGRGVNPEYNSQSKNGTSVVQSDPNYFLSGYQPKNVNGSLYSGGASAYSNPYGNAYNGYGNMGYGSTMGMGYNSMYGMGMGYGSMYGMGMGYGSMMGMGYGGYSSFYSPYSSMFSMGFGSMYGMYSPYSMMGMGMYGMYSPYSYGGYSGYGYPHNGVTVINGGDSRSTVTGRHSSRSNSLNNYVDNTRSADNTSIVGTNGRVREGGRVSSSSNSTPNYYDRSWRDNSNNFSNSNGNNQGNWNDGGNTRSGWGGNNNGWGNSGNNTRSSFDNSGSRGSFGGGGFSGGSSGGGGGGGHSRGRN